MKLSHYIAAAFGLVLACVVSGSARAQTCQTAPANSNDTTCANTQWVNRAFATNSSAGTVTVSCTANGLVDCAPAINSAAAMTINGQPVNVHLAAGTYLVRGAVSLSGQCLFGDGRQNTTILMDPQFSPGAAGELLINGREQASPCVHDVAFQDTEPNTPTATLTSTSITGTAVAGTVVSGTPVNGNLLYDSGGASSVIAANTLLSNVVVTGSTFTATASVSQSVSSRAMFTGLGRTQFLGLGSCDAITTGCAYPPNILIQNSNRFRLWNLAFYSTWNSIANAIGNGIGGFFIDNIEDGALNTGINLFSSFDAGHIKGYHHWEFGYASGTPLFALSLDGSDVAGIFGATGTIGGKSGEVDGLAIVDWFAEHARTQVNNGNTFALDFVAPKFSDGGSTLEITDAKWVHLASPSWVGTATGANTNCQLNITGGQVFVDNPHFSTAAGSTLGALCATNVNSAPRIILVGGRTDVNATNVPVMSISGTNAILSVSGHRFATGSAGSGAWTNPVVSVGALATTQFNNNVFDASPSGGNAGGLVIVTDSTMNAVNGNQWNGWSFTRPGNAGFYGNNSDALTIARGINLGWTQSNGVVGQAITGDTSGNFQLTTNGSGALVLNSNPGVSCSAGSVVSSYRGVVTGCTGGVGSTINWGSGLSFDSGSNTASLANPMPSGLSIPGPTITAVSGNTKLGVDGATGTSRTTTYTTAGVNRATAGLHGDAESGNCAGSPYDILAYDDSGTFHGTLAAGSRCSGGGPETGLGAPRWTNFAPFGMSVSTAASAPAGTIGNSETYTDAQPTVTLGAAPLTTVGSSAAVTVAWTSCCSGYLNTSSAVKLSGATTVNGLTPSGWFQVTSITDANDFTITCTVLLCGSNSASGSGSGGGSAVVAQPSFNTIGDNWKISWTNGAPGFMERLNLQATMNPAFFPTSGTTVGEAVFMGITSPNDTSLTNSWAAAIGELDVTYRGGLKGWYSNRHLAANLTEGLPYVCAPIQGGVTGGGTAGFCDYAVAIDSNGLAERWYNAYAVSPNSLVGVLQDSVSNHGGVALSFGGSLTYLGANPFATGASGSTVTITVPKGYPGWVGSHVNGENIYIPGSYTCNGVTFGAGTYAIGNVNGGAGTLTITGSGGSSGAGSCGGSNQNIYFATDVPYSVMTVAGEFAHGIVQLPQAKIDDSLLVSMQPLTGVGWAATPGTVLSSIVGDVSGNINLIPTGAGTIEAGGTAGITCAGNSVVTTVDGLVVTCTPSSGGTGTGTVNTGSAPAVAQYVGAGSTTVGPATISGDATIATGGALTVTKSSGNTILGMAFQAASAVSITGGSFTGLATPSNPTDAATKSYVDSAVAGQVVWHMPVSYATAAVLPNAPTYSNGASGVGATLTDSTSGAVLSVDGQTGANTLGTRILVQTQAAPAQNGIYSVTTSGVSSTTKWVLTRVTDFNTVATGNVALGAAVLVTVGGSANLAGSAFVMNQTAAITIGSTALTWAQNSAGGNVTATLPMLSTANNITFQNIPATSVPANTTGGSATPSGSVPYGVTGNSTLLETGAGGLIAATVLPPPGASTLGGVESLGVVAHRWINTISTGGVPAATQPASTDLSDLPVPISSGGTGTATGAGTNTVFAGPGSGGAGAPAFRALVGADLPPPSAVTLGGVESLSVVPHLWINTISTAGVPSATRPASTDLSDLPIPISSGGTGTATGAGQNAVFAGPSSAGAGAPLFRALVGADLPPPSATTLGGVESLAAGANSFLTSITTSGVPIARQPAFTDISGVATFAQLPAITGPIILGRVTNTSGVASAAYTPSNGTDTTVALVHGSTANGQCAQFNDTVGTLIGAACSGGGPSGPAVAAYYVAASGGSDANPGTILQPFATITHAISVTASSSTKLIYLRAGTYNVASSGSTCFSNLYGIGITAGNEGLTLSYTPSDGIDTAIIDGGNATSIGICVFNGANGVSVVGIQTTNWVNSGIRIAGGSGAGQGATGVTISDNIVKGTTGVFGGGIEMIGNVQGAKILRNDIENINTQGILWTDSGAGNGGGSNIDIEYNFLRNTCIGASDCGPIYLQNIQCDTGACSSGQVIAHNYMTGSKGAYGVYLDDWSSYVTVQYNTILMGSSTATNPACTIIHGGQNNTFQYNICDLGGANGAMTNTGPLLQQSSAGHGTPTMVGNVFQDNIIVAKSTSSPAGSGYKTFTPNPPTPADIRNNLYWNYNNQTGGVSGINNTAGTGATVDSNPTGGNAQIRCYVGAVDQAGPAASAPVYFSGGGAYAWGPQPPAVGNANVPFPMPQTGTAPSWGSSC